MVLLCLQCVCWRREVLLCILCKYSLSNGSCYDMSCMYLHLPSQFALRVQFLHHLPPKWFWLGAQDPLQSTLSNQSIVRQREISWKGCPQVLLILKNEASAAFFSYKSQIGDIKQKHLSLVTRKESSQANKITFFWSECFETLVLQDPSRTIRLALSLRQSKHRIETTWSHHPAPAAQRVQ